MSGKTVTILTHGGAGSKNEYSDGTLNAAEACVESVRSGAAVIDAVCRAVAVLEDDSRFNAGVGSHRRSDGSVQMDAAVMDDGGRFGAVAAVEGYRNPIHIARCVAETEYRVLAGRGAAEFARQGDFITLSADQVTEGGEDFSTGDRATDTVGAVAYDGKRFAAGLSTGGIKGAHPGRVGDVPLIGCGLYAGSVAAVAATGSGEAITMNLTAIRAYQLLEKGRAPEDVLREALSWFDDSDAFGLILVTREGHAGGSNRSMAWSELSIG